MEITALYASLAGLLIVVLGLRTAFGRRASKIGIGDGNDDLLMRRMRVHGNAVENIPIALILLGLLEINMGHPILLHALGATLLVGRLLHVWGLSSSAGVSFGRMYGMLLTWGMILACALVNLYTVLMN
jgi:uncharacterized membrane protein YecN with MAPEG domain